VICKKKEGQNVGRKVLWAVVAETPQWNIAVNVESPKTDPSTKSDIPKIKVLKLEKPVSQTNDNLPNTSHFRQMLPDSA
jgi:hypothetical protein